MFNSRFLKTVVLGLMVCSSAAFARLPSQAERAFSKLSREFNKTGVQLVVDHSSHASAGVTQADSPTVVAVQMSLINTEVRSLSRVVTQSADDALTPSQRFVITQSKNSLDFLRRNFSLAICNQAKRNGYTAFERQLLLDFEPTAIESGRIESEVLTRTFTILHGLCRQLALRVDI